MARQNLENLESGLNIRNKINSNFTEVYNDISGIGDRNSPSGYVGIENDGSVIGTFASRRDTYDNISQTVLAAGELAFTTDTKDTFLGDGVTQGGVFLHGTPKFIGEEITVNLDTSKILSEYTLEDMFTIDGLSTGIYKYEFDVYAWAPTADPPVNPSTWGFFIVTSSWVVNMSLPYPPGIYPEVYGIWSCIWDDGAIRSDSFPYISYPLHFNQPSSTTFSSMLKGRFTGLLYHTRGPSGTIANAPLNSFVIFPLGVGGNTTGLRINLFGNIQRIK
jgi:hypothetical protein